MCRILPDWWTKKEEPVAKGMNPSTHKNPKRKTKSPRKLVTERTLATTTEKRVNNLSPEYLAKKQAMESLYQTSSTPTFIQEQKMTSLTYKVPSQDFPKKEDVFATYGYDTLDFKNKIGKGNFGQVFQGRRLIDGTRVAIKELLDATNEKHLLHTRNEIFALMKVNHPNVVKLLDHFIINDDLYLIMEFVEGDTLKKRVKKRGTYTETEAKVIMKQIIAGVKHLHDLGIAHRDIKLENVMITKSGHCKIADFGLSRVGRRKKTGIIIMERFAGTQSFMAPEVIIHEPYDAFAADVYSLGVCLYILINKLYPFNFGPHEKEKQYQKQMAEDYLMESKYTKRLRSSEELCKLILAMLSPHPEDRITLKDALEHPWFTGEDFNKYLTRKGKEKLKDGGEKKVERVKKIEPQKKVEEAKKSVDLKKIQPSKKCKVSMKVAHLTSYLKTEGEVKKDVAEPKVVKAKVKSPPKDALTKNNLSIKPEQMQIKISS